MTMRNNVSKRWKLSGFLLIILSLLFACENPGADPDDFTAQDLSGKDFSVLSIWGFNLSGKNLQNTNFDSSDVSGTTFIGADLRGASFRWAWLYGANFTNADLRGANLDGACQLEAAIWTGALLDPKWAKVVALFEDGQLITQDLSGYDLSSVCFDEIDWEGPDFSNANLKDAVFQPDASNLANASFRNANLNGTIFAGQPDFTNTDFTGAIFWDTDFTNADFTGAILRDANLCQEKSANFSGTEFSDEQLSQAIFGAEECGGSIQPTRVLP